MESQAELGCRRSRLEGEAPGFCTGEDAFDSEKQTGRGLNRGLFPLHGDVSGGGSAAPGCHLAPALASLHPWHPMSFLRPSCLACFSQWQSGCCRSSVPWTGQEEGEGPRDNPLFCLADVCGIALRISICMSWKVRPRWAHHPPNRWAVLGSSRYGAHVNLGNLDFQMQDPQTMSPPGAGAPTPSPAHP